MVAAKHAVAMHLTSHSDYTIHMDKVRVETTTKKVALRLTSEASHTPSQVRSTQVST